MKLASFPFETIDWSSIPKEEKLTSGMCYLVGDNNEPHRSFTTSGCKLFIVD
jgi:hypothetical protein